MSTASCSRASDTDADGGDPSGAAAASEHAGVAVDKHELTVTNATAPN